jgi:hypothetical protein
VAGNLAWGSGGRPAGIRKMTMKGGEKEKNKTDDSNWGEVKLLRLLNRERVPGGRTPAKAEIFRLPQKLSEKESRLELDV